MTVRFYSSIAQETQLTGSITNVSTTIVVTAVTGFPSSTPYTLAIDYNTASEELVTVTGTSGTTLTVTRGSDGTSAISHNAGAKVRHVSSARDFSDSRSHENATTDIHGVPPGASLVSTTGTQTLTNKTISGGTVSGAAISGGAFTGAINSSANITGGTYTLSTINSATFNNIGPLGAWTTFTPTLQTAGGNITGTPAAFNTGRYIKVGRYATVHMETSGSAGMVIPGGDSSSIIWNVPAILAPRNPASTVVLGAGNSTINFILGIGFGPAIYTNSLTGFVAMYISSGAYVDFNGTNLKAGYPVSLDLQYETAT